MLVYRGLIGDTGIAMFAISVLITLAMWGMWGMAMVESVKRNRWL